MLTLDQVVFAILIPAAIAGLIGVVGRWRKWAWMMPLAVGAGFIAGYVKLVGGREKIYGQAPHLPPRDATDWLFWLAIPATILAMIGTRWARSWGWIFAVLVLPAVYLIARPRLAAQHGLSPGEFRGIVIALTQIAVLVAYAAHASEKRIGSLAVALSLCIAMGGAAVIAMASGSLTLGTYGLAAAAGLGITSLLHGRVQHAGSLAIFAAPVMIALLAGGYFYAEVSWINLVLLASAPAWMLVGQVVPSQRLWVRGLVAILAVGVAVAIAAVPAAIAAKKDAESIHSDGY